MALTEKRKRFVNEYLIDLNATQAAIRAGYSKKTAYSIGEEILKKPEIQAAIQERQKELQNKTEITQERVIEELAKIGLSNITDYIEYKTILRKTGTDNNGNDEFDWLPTVIARDSTEVDGSPIQEVSVGKDGTFKFKMYDKLGALEKLGRHLGLFEPKPQKDESETEKLISGMSDLVKLIQNPVNNRELPDDE